MSFALTTPQVRNQTKKITRRIGWKDLRRGTWVQPVVKGQGLKRGEHVEKIGGPIRILSARRERVDALLVDEAYGRAEVLAEGFPDLSPAEFVAMFCQANDCKPSTRVTRIEFEYVGEPDRRDFPGPIRWACRRCGNPRRRAECLSCGNTELITDERRVPGLVS